MDTLFGPSVRTPSDLADALVGWLAAHGAPVIDIDAIALRAAESVALVRARQVHIPA